MGGHNCAKLWSYLIENKLKQSTLYFEYFDHIFTFNLSLLGVLLAQIQF